MNNKHKIEIFSAGCGLCQKAIDLVKEIANENCEVVILDMHQKNVEGRAQSLGIQTVPTILVDGRIAPCCQGKGINEDMLRELLA